MARQSGRSVAEVFRNTVARLGRARLHYGHGTHNARDEAALLILHVLRLAPQPLSQHADRQLTSAQTRRLEALVARRIREHLPAAYLTREAWLGEHRFYIDRRVIVPRSFIAELLRERLAPWVHRPVRHALDLCTGSGCLAILLAHAYARASVDASDLSLGALAVARRNIAHYALPHRVQLIRSDLFDALGEHRYDLIVCNPPYVTDARMARLPAEYRYEPRRALAGGGDGLALVHRILQAAPQVLTRHGMLVCEIGHNRCTLENAYPRVPFVWLETSAGPDHVFLLERADFPLRRDASVRGMHARQRLAQESGRPRER
jgi:ribosomal protein L3 glutamine methyltransferase